jgi:hypothetical protein
MKNVSVLVDVYKLYLYKCKTSPFILLVDLGMDTFKSICILLVSLSVLPSESRCEFFLPVLPALVRIGQAFPPLCEDIISLLTQLGHVCGAHISATRNKLATGNTSITSHNK